MSVPAPIVRAKPSPRWSFANPKGLLPLLIAGLPGSSAWVRESPPLSLSGARSGSRPSRLPVPNTEIVQFGVGQMLSISELVELMVNAPKVAVPADTSEPLLFATIDDTSRNVGRAVLFAYDLRNEPEIGWDGPAMVKKWNDWLGRKYGAGEKLAQAWSRTNQTFELGSVPVPKANDAPGNRELLDYQSFREDLADEWTRRQVAAIKTADARALVTVGLIQWSVPSLLPGVRHYSGFRPERQAKLLDFLEIHFYPLDRGAYEYRSEEEEARNLAYLQSVVAEVAKPGKPVVVAEFGWYGGGKPRFDGGRHPFASEDQQAGWCRKLVETTAGTAVGWLNWGLYDQPEATDVSELTGLLTADGKLKAWGREFQKLARKFSGKRIPSGKKMPTPSLDWDACLTSTGAGNSFREQYYQALMQSRWP